MMKNILIILAIVLIASPLWAATNKISTAQDDAAGQIALKISNDQALGGIAIALKFAEVGSDVMLTNVDFSGTRMQDVELKEAVIDNEKKTVLIYAIPLKNYIDPGNDPIAKLTFSGSGEVKPEPTTIAKQEGISLVSTDAKELTFDTDFSVTSGGRPLPTSFAVSQNYPNPFNASTVIRYSLPVDSRVKIEIFNILGQKVRTLVDEVQTAGYKSIEWNGTNASNQTVASGVYFYKIQADKRTEIKQMTLLK